MDEAEETKGSEDTGPSIKSFFPQIFAAKLEMYCQGDPSAYVGQQPLFYPERADSETFFQRRITDNIGRNRRPATTMGSVIATTTTALQTATTAAMNLKNPFAQNAQGSNSVGIDISRMFDEIELRPELADMQEDGLTEYAMAGLAEIGPETRMAYISQQAAALLLNDTRNDLNEFAKSLLNNAVPDSYNQLISKAKPQDPKMSETDKLAAARLAIANAFVAAYRVCYCQKLQDLNIAANQVVGFEADVLTVANEDELNALHLEKKLTIIKVLEVDGTPKYFAYGNTDGSKWDYTEMPESALAKIDFANDTHIPSSMTYYAFNDALLLKGAHTLSDRDTDINSERNTRYTDYYMRVISPIETCNRRPITEDTYVIPSAEGKTTEQLQAEVAVQGELLGNAYLLISTYIDSVTDKTMLASLQRALADVESALQEVEVINEFIKLDINADLRMQEFLNRPRNRDLEEVVVSTANTVLTNLIHELADLDQKVLRNVKGDLGDLRGGRTQHLHAIIMQEQQELMMNLEKINKFKQAYNIEAHFNSPAYLLVALQAPMHDLTRLIHYIDDNIADDEMAEVLKTHVASNLHIITSLEQDLCQENISPETISAAKDYLQGPVVVLAKRFANAEENNNRQEVRECIELLQQEIGYPVVKIKLHDLCDYIIDTQNVEQYSSCLSEASKLIADFSLLAPDKLRSAVEGSFACETADLIQELKSLPKDAHFKASRIRAQITKNLSGLENWLTNRDGIPRARDNLDKLMISIGRMANISNEDKARLNSLIIDTQEALTAKQQDLNDASISKLLNSPIVGIANTCANTDDPEELQTMMPRLMSVLVEPPSTREQARKAVGDTQRAFSSLFSGVRGKLSLSRNANPFLRRNSSSDASTEADEEQKNEDQNDKGLNKS